MSRGIHADVVTALAGDSFNIGTIVSIGFDTPVYLTTYQHDISHGGNTYLANGHLLHVDTISENQDTQVGYLDITLSGADQTYVSIFLNGHYVGREVVISRVIVDDDGNMVGAPFMPYVGQIDAFDFTDEEINVSISSHWADFERINSMRTNDNSQQSVFPGDKGMEYASLIVKDIKWGVE